MSKAETLVSSTAEPMRTCIGCRRRDSRSHLLRMVRSPSADGSYLAVADPRRRMPGRGAWLHPSEACLALALKRRAVGRALPGAVHTAGVEDYVSSMAGAAENEIRTVQPKAGQN